MKKILLFLMAFIFALAIIGCDGATTSTEEPTTGLPTTEEVTTEAPTTEATTTVEVTTEAPTTTEVTSEEQTTEEVTTQTPTTELPTTEAPTTEAPTTEAPTTEIPDVTYTIYYYNSQGWDEVYAFAWDTEGALLGELMPGTLATQDDETDWWSIDVVGNIDVSSIGILFNNGDGLQTPDITLYSSMYVYMTYSGQSFMSKLLAEDSITSTRIYYYNALGWDEVNAYAWNGSSEIFGAWQGVLATEDETNEDWYYVDVPYNADQVSFNIKFSNSDASLVTNDIIVNSRFYVYITDVDKYDTMSAAEAAYPKTTVWFYNSEDWTDVYAYTAMGNQEPIIDWGFIETLTQDGDTNWWYLDVAYNLVTDPMTLIFTDGDTLTTESIYLDTKTNVYVTIDEVLFDNKASAEASIVTTTKVWFYNSEDWTDVYAFTAMGNQEPVIDWGFIETLTQDGDTNWWYLDIENDLVTDPMTFIFTDGDTLTTGSIYIDTKTNVYVTIDEVLFDNKASAEASIVTPTKVWFYNSEDWTDVYAYTAMGYQEPIIDWGFIETLTQDGDTNWWYLDIENDLVTDPMTFIFTDGDTLTTESIYIDTKTNVYVTIDEVLFDNKASAEASIVTPTRVWYYNSEGWTEVYGYAFDAGYIGFTGEWPGTLMTQVAGTNWWYYDIPVNLDVMALNIKFHNNDFNESVYATLDNSTDIYITYYGDTYASVALAEAGYLNPTMTDVYFYNSDGWASVYAFAFDDYGRYLDNWPGTAATQVDTSDWWVISVPSNLADTITFVFNNGEEETNLQTADINISLTTGVYVVASANVYQDQVTAESNLETITRIYFYNPSSLGWTQPYAHIWNYSGTNPLLTGVWPGNQLTQDTTDPDWWYVDVSTTTASFMIVMNNGEGTQSPDYRVYSYDAVYILFGDDGYGNTFLDVFPSLEMAESIINMSE